MAKGSSDQTTPGNPANERTELTEFEKIFFVNMKKYGGDPAELNFTCAADYGQWLQQQKAQQEGQQELTGDQVEPE